MDEMDYNYDFASANPGAKDIFKLQDIDVNEFDEDGPATSSRNAMDKEMKR